MQKYHHKKNKRYPSAAFLKSHVSAPLSTPSHGLWGWLASLRGAPLPGTCVHVTDPSADTHLLCADAPGRSQPSSPCGDIKGVQKLPYQEGPQLKTRALERPSLPGLPCRSHQATPGRPGAEMPAGGLKPRPPPEVLGQQEGPAPSVVMCAAPSCPCLPPKGTHLADPSGSSEAFVGGRGGRGGTVVRHPHVWELGRMGAHRVWPGSPGAAGGRRGAQVPAVKPEP